MKKFFLFALTVSLLTACNDKDAPGSTTTTDTSSTTANDNCARQERNKQTALASVNAFMNKNVNEALKNVDSNAVDYGDGSMPAATGKDSVSAWMNMWLTAVPDYKGENLMAAADGNKVMVYGVWSGTWKGDFMGMKATGKSFRVQDVDIFTFNDLGMITEHRNVQSSATLGQQIGMPMPEQKK